ncbi:phospholipase D-like domain-containing protein [Chryseobacterium sp. CFS15]|uniref:phospholipase D-like domain-containing protein n=1 Tax=Chryseobacterium sp. CFS15 TaxID=2986946 RepID=UPI0028090DCF|nr:phospholipase D-like domain-containing protein [Chryseobacterium sp. CFS15]MDQ8140526.1 phospholipase D-like domain-containing protein [Chryseobacterium sp. CFS15]
MTTIVQDSLSDADEILSRIKTELLNAQSEILVAMAWFTNPELFDILEKKAAEQVNISLIISDQPDNEKLNFESLRKMGVKFNRIKNIGYGMMHLKFCIIDRQIAISGSYNWSNNAKNNHEQVLVTTFPKTVDELVTTFFKIENRIEKINNGISMEDIEKEEQSEWKEKLNDSSEIPTLSKKEELSFQEKSLKDFQDVLTNIIATEVGSFDKNLLKANAYQRANENQGDHQILPQALDSLYSNFINDIEVIEEKKTRLKTKIEEQQKLSIGNVEIRTENEIESLTSRLNAETKNAQDLINTLDKSTDEKKFTIKSNTDTQIPFLQNKIELVRKKIIDLKTDIVKPPLNVFLMTVLGILCTAILAYIFVFYSSVAYIFIFSKEDTMAVLDSGAMPTSTEVFDPNAFTKASSKGFGGILFLILFVFIPIALGMMNLFLKNSKSQNSAESPVNNRWYIESYVGIPLIIIVDSFMAYKVARNIDEINYLTNQTDRKMSFSEIIFSENFWLVFILGTLGIYLLKLIVNKIYSLIHERTTTHQQQKIKFSIENFENEIAEFENQIMAVKKINDGLSIEILAMERDKKEYEKLAQNLPLECNRKIGTLRNAFLSFREKVENLSQIFKSQVDNDKLPVSRAEMENRINIFMEGWSKYLYELFAVKKAEIKTSEAINECESWLSGISLQKNLTTDFAQN